jgi:hypothetical protein
MAVAGWKSPKEFSIELPTKHYYLTISDNERGKQVLLKEWRKSHGLKRSETHGLVIFESHLRDVLKGLLKVMKRLDLDVADILAKYQAAEQAGTKEAMS